MNIEQAVQQTIEKALTRSNAIRVGELIEFLESKDPTTDVTVNDGKTKVLVSPDRFTSYHGFYDHLLLPTTTSLAPWENTIVHSYHAALIHALGSTICGYKDGVYEVTENTPIWIAPTGETKENGLLVDIKHTDNKVILTTGNLIE